MAQVALPTLAATWSPPSSCLASTAYYKVILEHYTGTDGDDMISFINLFGIPTPTSVGDTTSLVVPTGECVPPEFNPDTPYLTDGECPTGYTAACKTGGTYEGVPASTVTCCPSGAFDFRCNDGYGCRSNVPSGVTVTWTGTRTDLAISPPTERPETTSDSSDAKMYAWGIFMISTAPASSTSSSGSGSGPTSTGESNSSSSSGLSTGAKAGIGVGVGLGVILLLAGAWFLYRRRHHMSQARKGQPDQPPEQQSESKNYYSAQGIMWPQQTGSGMGSPGSPSPAQTRPISELPDQRSVERYELS